MKLNPPKKNVWWIAFILAILGVIGFVLTYFMGMPWLPVVAFFLVLIAYLLVMLGTVLKGF